MVRLYFESTWSTSGSEREQSETLYARVLESFSAHGAEGPATMRLDHFTSSQEWLPLRQQERARAFGKPAKLASTGVRARLPAGCHLAVGAMAVSGVDTKVLIPGETYGMPWISTAVEAGDLVFISGILTGPAQAAGAGFGSSVEHCIAQLGQILNNTGKPQPLRIDAYIQAGAGEQSTRSALEGAFGAAGAMAAITPLVFENGMSIEINVLASRSPVTHRTIGPWRCSIGSSCAAAWAAADDVSPADPAAAVLELADRLAMRPRRLEVASEDPNLAAGIANKVTGSLAIPALAYGQERAATRLAVWFTPAGQ